MNAETTFYRKHYGGGVGVGATPSDEFAIEMLAKGRRYALVAERLSKQTETCGCLAEIGCGGGEALLILAQSHDFERIVGVDIALTGTGSHQVSNIEFITSNLNERWPFEDGEVDHLIAMMVIEHLFDPFHSFHEIKRCLSKRGVAYVNLPLVTAIRSRIRLLVGRIPETSVSYENWFKRKEWDGNHLHYFSLRSINDLAHACGLRVTDARGVGRHNRIKTLFLSLLAAEVTFCLEHIE